jgi:hypothetical protein
MQDKANGYYGRIEETNRIISTNGNADAILSKAIILRKLQAGVLSPELALYRLRYEATK